MEIVIEVEVISQGLAIKQESPSSVLQLGPELFATGLWQWRVSVCRLTRIPTCASHRQVCARVLHLHERWARMHAARANGAAHLPATCAEPSPLLLCRPSLQSWKGWGSLL